MRLIDADALTKVIVNERDRIQDTYGENDEYVLCLNKYALSMVESAHTIDAIPVEWLREWQDEVGTINEWWPIIERIITVWREDTPWREVREAQECSGI